MCDFTTVSILLATAMTAITLAAILIGSAIATNAGFFTAGGSVALMIAASISSGVAAATLYAAMAAAGDFFNCVVAGNPAAAACAGNLDNFRNILIGIATVLTAQVIGCVATATIAWIPWAGAVPMAIILGALVTQSLTMPYLSIAFNQLRDCVNSAVRMEIIPGWVLGFIIVATIVVVIVTIYASIIGLPQLPKAFNPPRR